MNSNATSICCSQDSDSILAVVATSYGFCNSTGTSATLQTGFQKSALASKSYDYVVVGAGVRLPPRRLAIFEAVINAVHKAAPGVAIAFNTRPEHSADAVARWVPEARRYCPDIQRTLRPARAQE